MSKPYAPGSAQIHNPQVANVSVPFVDLKQQYTSIKSEVDAAIANLLTLIEPLLIGFLGVTIGSIVIAMYLPLFTLIGKLSQGH